MHSNARAFLTALTASLLTGCASSSASSEEAAASSPPAAESAQIEIAAEPEFKVADDHTWPAYFAGSTVGVVASKPAASVSREEHEAFLDAFAESFYGTCFRAADADTKPDFLVYLAYEAKVVDSQTGRQIEAKGVSELAAQEASRGGRRFPISLEHFQPTNTSREADMRQPHAAVLGRLLAQKHLQKLSRSSRLATFGFELLLSGFDRHARRDALGVVRSLEGLAPDTLQERSSGGPKAGILLTFEAYPAPATLLKRARAAFKELGVSVEPRGDTMWIATAPK